MKEELAFLEARLGILELFLLQDKSKFEAYLQTLKSSIEKSNFEGLPILKGRLEEHLKYFSQIFAEME